VSLLEQRGYRDVRHYAGGLHAWRAAGLPFDRGDGRTIEPERRVGAEPAGAPA